jgi:large subunit ribosomal protein L6
MSRIGRKPVVIPEKVKVVKEGSLIKIEGPKGKATHPISEYFDYKIENNILTVVPKASVDGLKNGKALFGMERATIANKIIGVTEGYTEVLLLKGVGYRASLAGRTVNFTLGFSHPSEYQLPEGITVVVDNQTKLTITGVDKHTVGQVAAEIKSLKEPEPYQGKGIMYEGEHIRRKAGKSAAGAKAK